MHTKEKRSVFITNIQYIEKLYQYTAYKMSQSQKGNSA